MKAIADTGFVVDFANRSDRHHQWAVALAWQVTESLFDVRRGLAETAFHLRDAALTLALVRDGLVRPALDAIAELPRLQQLAKRYADWRPRLPIITMDVSDFPIYRRNQREVLQLLHSPGL